MNELSTVEQTKLDIMRQMGVDPSAVNQGGNFLPTLKVNYDEEDEQGNDLKKGLFTITEQEEAVYAETATFRPMAQMYQYVDFNQTDNKVVNKSTIENNLNAEFPDERGTTKCGKPSGKYLKANPDEAEKYKSIKVHRLVYGVATIDGKTATGKEVRLENVPVVLDLKGANFMAFEEEFVSRMPKGALLPNYELALTRSSEKNGSLRYFVIHYKVDFNNVLPVDDMVIDTVVGFHEIIERDNKNIMDKYKAALKDGVREQAMSDNMLDHDFDLDNEIPF